MSNITEVEPELAGRDTAPLVSLMLAVLGGLAAIVGFVLYVGMAHTDQLFVWEVASPLTAALLGAGFLGAVPMMFSASVRRLWEEARIGLIPAGVLVATLLGVTVLHVGETRVGGGPIIALVLSIGWVLAMAGLTAGAAFALMKQANEPGLPLARTVPIPRAVTPLIALQGAAHLGLGFGLLVEPTFWSDLIPWELSTFDARALGAWCLTLGVALLQAQAEDELHRVRPGLLGVLAIGALGLVALVVRHGDVDWSGWPAICLVVLVGGLFLTGVIGLVLARRSRRQPATDA